MDATTVISNNYSKVVTQYNKIIRMNECLKKENKDIQAQKYHVLKAYEKLKLFAIRQNRKLINDSRMRGDGNNVIISDFCEESPSCFSSTKTAVIDEQTIEISTDTCDSEKLSECSVESDSSVCDSLSQLMRDIELICGTKTACNAHVELITQLKNTVINAMQLDQSNEATLNKQQEEINHYIQQIDDLKNKNECKAIDISKMKQNISELADALEGQYLENKKLKSYNVDQCCIIDEYLNTQQVLECKLSQAENQCNDLTIYSTQLENNLKEEHNENCEKADIICNLQEQLQDYNSMLDEFHDQITLSANEIAKFKEEHCTLNNTIDALTENNSILKIELKCVGLKLNNSIELENIRFDENEILKKNVKNLETALEIFKCENNSLVEKSIKDRLEVLWSIIKIHISENEKKHYEENITELNNFIECAAAKYSNIQKEIEICNSKLLKTTEDNKDLQLQLMEVRKNLDIACENLKCAQQQLLDTKDKEESAIMMQSKKIESISSIYTQTEIPSSFETISVIGKYSSTIISETEISNCTERIPLTVIKIDVPKTVSRTEISNCTESELFCTEPLAVIETDVPKTVSRTEISNNTEPILSVIKTDVPKIVSRTEISNNTKPILSVIETESTDVQRGQSPKVNKKYEENGLSESNSYEKEIAQMCLESETNKNLQINNCMTSKLVDTRIQKRISKFAASPSYPKLRFKSNIPIQKTCRFPLDISSSSESNGFVTSCTCSNNSCEPKCDCIESYIKKSEKQLPDELHKVERKEKQYKSRIYDNDLQNSHKNPSSTDTYDAHMRYCNISLENVEKYTASVSNNVDNTSPKTKGDELENANALQEMSQNINENREEMSQNINENREDQTMKKHEEPGLAKQNSIEQVKTTKLKLQKQKTKQTKKSKKKIMSSKTSQKPEFRYNLPCTSCNDENCYYNKTAPKNLEECQIFLKQIMTRRKK